MTDVTSRRTLAAETVDGRDSFLAVVITTRRTGVLAELADEATAHFGHDQHQARNVRVVSAGADGTLLATADYSALAPLTCR